MVNGIWQSLGLDLVYINVYAIFIKILHMKQEFGPGSIFRILTSAKLRPITIDIPQYLGLDLVNINAYAFCFCFKIFHTVQEIGLVSFFLNLGPGKASANGKWHLTIPWTRYHQHQCVRICFSKYSLWFNNYGQFLLTDYRRTTSQTDYNRTHKLTTGR